MKKLLLAHTSFLERLAKAFDQGVDAVWFEPVCSVCGQNHDRDESAACEGCKVVTFRQWVDAVPARLTALQELADHNYWHGAYLEVEKREAELREAIIEYLGGEKAARYHAEVKDHQEPHVQKLARAALAPPALAPKRL